MTIAFPDDDESQHREEERDRVFGKAIMKTWVDGQRIRLHKRIVGGFVMYEVRVGSVSEDLKEAGCAGPVGRFLCDLEEDRLPVTDKELSEIARALLAANRAREREEVRRRLSGRVGIERDETCIFGGVTYAIRNVIARGGEVFALVRPMTTKPNYASWIAMTDAEARAGLEPREIVKRIRAERADDEPVEGRLRKEGIWR